MADLVLLTPEELEEEATQLVNTAKRNDDVINTLNSLEAGLLDGWEGDAQRAFLDSYRKKRETFKSFTEDMTKLANDVKTFAAHMRDEEQQKAAQARELGA
ncbi:MAG: WXG100 family type VII secretion target [Synergistaceae bacterium]|nr:WXG100 family type VII secretion target [Synergistaceae bacterium]MBQ3398768.1 WXG100 family type VII secretion target [Synergistaceae bacterium]MBQ6002983.1 WXG100 family type VII secretion target [Synergistaceae bacterium]MBR0034169.1 WXG100 family type VII secretion target [Synergistaceae bacterium]